MVHIFLFSLCWHAVDVVFGKIGMFLFQVTAVCFTEKADNIMSGGIDNHIKMWDLKHGEVCAF